MIDLFVTPLISKEKKKSTRVTTTGRVITSNEYCQKLIEKQDKERKDQEEKEVRKKEREKRKSEKMNVKKSKVSKRKKIIEHQQESCQDEDLDFDFETDEHGATSSKNHRSSHSTKKIIDYKKIFVETDDSSSSEESSSSENNDINKCKACNKKYPPKDKRSKRKKDEWIFCEKCERWMHDVCENVRVNKISDDYIC